MRTDDTKDDAPATIRPLTHRTSGGDVYTRPEAVERHIAEALALTSLDLAMRVQIRDADADGYLCDECLVYLLQEYQRGRSVERINSVAAELLWRSSRLIHTRLSSLGQMAEDAYHDVIDELFVRLLDVDGARGDYFQVRFGAALKRLTITVFQRYVRDRHRAQQTVSIASTGASQDDDSDRAQEWDVEDHSLTGEQQTLYREALASLPEHLRMTFVLRYYYRWPIEDKDSAVSTISRYFDKTPRTIRNWLNEAEVLLERWRGVQQ